MLLGESRFCARSPQEQWKRGHAHSAEERTARRHIQQQPSNGHCKLCDEPIPISDHITDHATVLRIIIKRVVIQVGVWIDSGSRHETGDTNGAATFFEHLLYTVSYLSLMTHLIFSCSGNGQANDSATANGIGKNRRYSELLHLSGPHRLLRRVPIG